MKKNYQTQWAGQFGVAHELTRRGYLASFTIGNAPATDLLCESPAGVAFSIQVKSLASKTCFLYQEALLNPRPGLFFVFVLLPPSLSERAEYFVVDNEQFLRLADEQERIFKDNEKKRGKPYAKFSPGIEYSTLARHDFQDAWKSLPA